MPNDRKDANYFDLAGVKELSKRVRGEAGPAAPERHERFSLRGVRYRGDDPGETTAALPGQLAAGGERYGSSTWDKVLDWCIDAMKADAAFLLDGRGLPIAERGGLAEARIEVLGARLMAALDQLEQLRDEGDDTPVTVAFRTAGEGWSGLRVAAPSGLQFVVAVRNGEPLTAGTRKALERFLAGQD